VNVQQQEGWKADLNNPPIFGRKDVEVKKQKKRPGRDIQKGSLLPSCVGWPTVLNRTSVFKFKWQDKKA